MGLAKPFSLRKMRSVITGDKAEIVLILQPANSHVRYSSNVPGPEVSFRSISFPRMLMAFREPPAHQQPAAGRLAETMLQEFCFEGFYEF